MGWGFTGEVIREAGDGCGELGWGEGADAEMALEVEVEGCE